MIRELFRMQFISAEKECSIFGAGECWKESQVVTKSEITMETKVRLIRAGIVR